MRYKTIVIHVDDETGEIICKWDAIESYHLINSTKNASINKKAFTGTITITKYYRKNTAKQLELFGK